MVLYHSNYYKIFAWEFQGYIIILFIICFFLFINQTALKPAKSMNIIIPHSVIVGTDTTTVPFFNWKEAVHVLFEFIVIWHWEFVLQVEQSSDHPENTEPTSAVAVSVTFTLLP